MRLRVLTWNLMHGRSVPPAGRDLNVAFSRALADWDWDVSLLQEVPPWWPAALAAELDAEYRLVLTSRNALLVLRRAIATRRPDLIKANGGGCNAILARSDRIVAHRTQRLCRLPERRWAHGVRLACGIWVANVHATAGSTAAASRDVAATARAARGWAGAEPLVLGGNLNLRHADLDRLHELGASHVDHLLASPELEAEGPAEVLDRGRLSDHSPLAATLRWTASSVV